MSSKQDDARIRKALRQLKPPSTPAVLDDDMLKTMKKVKVALRRSKPDEREIQRLLEAHTSKAAPVMHTERRMHPPLQFPLSLTSIINVLNTHLYLPTDNRTPLDFLVPLAHRYQSTLGGGSDTTFGNGSADKTNGNMLVTQGVPLGPTVSNSFASIFIKLISDRGGLIGFTPEVDWNYTDQWDANPSWANNIAGTIWFTAYLWLMAFDSSTMKQVSALRWQLWQHSNLVNSQAASSQSGSKTDAFLEFLALPGQPFLASVSLQLIEQNTIPANVPPPPNGDTAVAALSATVPSIWVSGPTN
jgi:hypothetical protein